MVRLNLAPPRKLGPVFDPDATGLARFIPRKPWWPLLPALIVGAPIVATVVLVHRFSERLEPKIA